VSALELQARQLWRGWADWRGYGRCDACERMRYCGRARRRGRRLCLECFEHAPEGRKQMRRLRR
jgi:hypothetical protein